MNENSSNLEHFCSDQEADQTRYCGSIGDIIISIINEENDRENFDCLFEKKAVFKKTDHNEEEKEELNEEFKMRLQLKTEQEKRMEQDREKREKQLRILIKHRLLQKKSRNTQEITMSLENDLIPAIQKTKSNLDKLTEYMEAIEEDKNQDGLKKRIEQLREKYEKRLRILNSDIKNRLLQKKSRNTQEITMSLENDLIPAIQKTNWNLDQLTEFMRAIEEDKLKKALKDWSEAADRLQKEMERMRRKLINCSSADQELRENIQESVDELEKEYNAVSNYPLRIEIAIEHKEWAKIKVLLVKLIEHHEKIEKYQTALRNRFLKSEKPLEKSLEYTDADELLIISRMFVNLSKYSSYSSEMHNLKAYILLLQNDIQQLPNYQDELENDDSKKQFAVDCLDKFSPVFTSFDNMVSENIPTI